VLSRRTFIGRTALAAGAIVSGQSPSRASAAPQRPLFTGVGITSRFERAALLKDAGADYIVESVERFLMPDRPDAEFQKQRHLAAASPLPVRGCNSFLRHPRLRCTGPDADHASVLAFSEIAFRRLAQAGGKFIGFGSNKARQVPDGWPKERADAQFVTLLRAMGPLAARHGITVAVESLRAAECNYLNRIREVVAVVAAANHPQIRILADLYHMAVMDDTPADLATAMPWVGLIEIAEKAQRTVPGVAGDDFRPYFSVLARAGYSGPITIEADGTPDQLKGAFETIASQAADVMSGSAGSSRG
jgi:sugar phosphate isomerase/epimerase